MDLKPLQAAGSMPIVDSVPNQKPCRCGMRRAKNIQFWLRLSAHGTLIAACEYVLRDSSEPAAYPAGCPGSKGRMKVRS
jgi:hypothetical protein